MKNQNILDKEIATGFIMFVFVKAFQDNFISSFPKIIKAAHENGLLLRHGLFIFLLLVYSLLPYVFVFTSYFILSYLPSYKFNYNFLGFNLQSFILPIYIGYILAFVMIRHYYPNVGLLSATVSPIIAIFGEVFYWDVKNLDHMQIIDIISILFMFSFFIILPKLIDYLFKIIHFITISHLVIFSLPLNFLICTRMTKTFSAIFLSNERLYASIVLIFLIDFFFVYLYISSIDFFGVLFHVNYAGFAYALAYIMVITTLIMFIILHVKKMKKAIFLVFIFGFICILAVPVLFILSIFYFSDFLGFTLPKNTINILFITFTIILLVFLYKFFLALVPQFFGTWWFKQKYYRMFHQIIDTIYENQNKKKALKIKIDSLHESQKKALHENQEQIRIASIEIRIASIEIDIAFSKIRKAFGKESSSKCRKFILQYFSNCKLSSTQKLEILSDMAEVEKEGSNSQDVLDMIAQIRQTIRQEQRQTELTSDVSPIAQDFLQNLTGFDFTDPITENNRTANISSIDSARQQLLDWLKGETPANPSIDKLLIYQWQDYEIGIGLKYSGQMGGDFYDLFQLPIANADNQVGVVISDFGLLVGDLTGHGVETALNLSKTHNFWAETDLSQDVLTTMQAFEQNFKTTFHPFPNREGCELCYLQLKDNEITLSRAGLHLGLIRANQWHKIAPPPHENFMAIGKWRSLPVKRYTRVELKAGETLIVYTDGLYENANQNGEQFGQDNFQQLLLQQQSLDMNSLIDTVFRTVYEYCQPEPLDDDETLLVIRRKMS